MQLTADASQRFAVVEQVKGNTTQNVIYGVFVDLTADGEHVTIATEGEDMIVARTATAAAVTNAEIGQGIIGSGTAGTNGVAVAEDVALNTRGVIIGGNTEVGTAANPAFYRVNFRSS